MFAKLKNKKNIPFLICLSVLIIAVIVFLVNMYRQHAGDREYEKIQNEVVKNTKDEDDSFKIDFDKLEKENKEIYAWIKVDGTRINYPILQSETDDSYYLDYTVDGSYGKPGAIYSEQWNAKDFSDINTILYGHNMKSGTMFRDLHEYESKDFMTQHSTFEIYLPDKELTYEVIMAASVPSTHLKVAYDLETIRGNNEFISDLRKNASKCVVQKDVILSDDDKIVTLSTCENFNPNKRWIVIGKLKDEKTY